MNVYGPSTDDELICLRNYYREPGIVIVNWGERAHKELAWQLKTEQVSRTINAIRHHLMITYKPQEINDEFCMFYEKLYTFEISQDVVKIETFLSGLTLSSLKDKDIKELDASFTAKIPNDTLRPMPSDFLTSFKDNFYRCVVKSVLTGCITDWYGDTNTTEWKAPQKEAKPSHHQEHLQRTLPSESSSNHQGSLPPSTSSVLAAANRKKV
ncbi:uncharacterized protein [Narcine bancroftii]|uniref:uncharacterized protein n=1 Tax=Narcine bancroftii TaxID=1343680 RepID=UPI00383158EE